VESARPKKEYLALIVGRIAVPRGRDDAATRKEVHRRDGKSGEKSVLRPFVVVGTG